LSAFKSDDGDVKKKEEDSQGGDTKEQFLHHNSAQPSHLPSCRLMEQALNSQASSNFLGAEDATDSEQAMHELMARITGLDNYWNFKISTSFHFSHLFYFDFCCSSCHSFSGLSNQLLSNPSFDQAFQEKSPVVHHAFGSIADVCKAVAIKAAQCC
jgi:hypothetical protein